MRKHQITVPPNVKEKPDNLQELSGFLLLNQMIKATYNSISQKFLNGYPIDAILKHHHQRAYRSRLNQASHDNHDNF